MKVLSSSQIEDEKLNQLGLMAQQIDDKIISLFRAFRHVKRKKGLPFPGTQSGIQRTLNELRVSYSDEGVPE